MSLENRLSALVSAIGADIKALFAGKQDALVSGSNIKTIGGVSLLGGGNVAVNAPGAVPIGGAMYYPLAENTFIGNDGTKWIKTGKSVPYSAEFLSLPAAGVFTQTAFTQLSGVSGNWSNVIFANGIFISASYGYNIVTKSINGSTWTSSNLPSTANWNKVCFGAEKFVILPYGSANAAISADGITWSHSALPAALDWNGLAYGNNIFVATHLVSSTGSSTYYTSPDGITWTLRNFPATANWRNVYFINNTFFAIAYGQVLSSSDGLTWTKHIGSIGIDLNSICYGNGKYIAPMLNNSSGFYSSTDGITWTFSGGLPLSKIWRHSIFFNGAFTIFDSASSNAATSTDGITWTLQVLPNNSTCVACNSNVVIGLYYGYSVVVKSSNMNETVMATYGTASSFGFHSLFARYL